MLKEAGELVPGRLAAASAFGGGPEVTVDSQGQRKGRLAGHEAGGARTSWDLQGCA